MESYSYCMSQELVRRGYEVHLFLTPKAEELPGAVCHKILSKNILVDFPRLRFYDMDVWHVMNSGYSPLACFKKNVVVHVHGNDFLKPWIGIDGPFIWRFRAPVSYLMMEYGFRKSFRILPNSRFTKSLLLKKFRRLQSMEHKLDVFNLGISEDFFSPPAGRGHRTRGEDRYEFITISRLTNKRKNVDSVIHAIDAIKKDGEFKVHYTVIGDGTDHPRLADLVKRFGLENEISVPGFLPMEDARERLFQSDLFIMVPLSGPKDVEGFGIVYIEANASGVPVLASRNSGAEDAVLEGVSGFFVETPTAEGIKNALYRFLRGQVRFDREKVMEHAGNFRWPRFVDRLENHIYREIG